MKLVDSRWYNNLKEVAAEASKGQEEDAGHGQGERPPGSFHGNHSNKWQ